MSFREESGETQPLWQDWNTATKWVEEAKKWCKSAPASRPSKRPQWPFGQGKELPKIRDLGDLQKAAEVSQTRFWCQARRIAMVAKRDVWNTSFQVAKFGEPVWFRGEPDFRAGRPLVPKVFRPDIYPDPDQRGARRTPEKFMLSQFRMQAIARHGRCPDEHQRALWMCLAQHWGLPTRLLDWTESILTAAWFATEDCLHDEHAESVIWAIAPALLNYHFVSDGPIFLLEGGHADVLVYAAFEGLTLEKAINQLFPTNKRTVDENREMKQFFNNARSAKSYRREPVGQVVLAVKAPQVETRMMMQQAAFTIHSNSRDLSSIEAKYPFLMRLVIDRRARIVIARQLAQVGIRRSTVFPDLQNLARDITDEWSSRLAQMGATRAF